MSSFTSDVMSSSIAGELPALLPPSGQSPNFADPDSQGHIYTGVATAITAMMIILVTIRQYTKYFIIRKLGWDDCIDLPDRRVTTQQPVYLGVVVVPPAMIFTKLTFFLVYLQVFRPLAWLRICVYIGSAITTAFYLGVWIYLLVSITPRNGQSFMEVALSPAQFKSLRTSVPIAGVGLATDLYLLVLPIAAVMQLQLPTRRKSGRDGHRPLLRQHARSFENDYLPPTEIRTPQIMGEFQVQRRKVYDFALVSHAAIRPSEKASL
ncbi:MAG: hypothetical protein Q9172_000017 [Xanthocarpia lactea]